MMDAYRLDRRQIAVDSNPNLRRPNESRRNRLDQMTARIACASCNGGFLNRLEQGAATGVRELFSGGITADGMCAVAKWLVTRHHWELLAQGHGRRAFVTDDLPEGVDAVLVAGGLPDFRRLHALYNEEAGALDGVHVSIGRSAVPGRPGTMLASGQTTVLTPKSAPDRAATSFAIHLEGLVLEVLVCVTDACKVSFRPGMRRLRPGERLALRTPFKIGTLDPKLNTVKLTRSGASPLVIVAPIEPGGSPHRILIPDTDEVLGPWVSEIDRSWIEAGFPDGAPILHVETPS